LALREIAEPEPTPTAAWPPSEAAPEPIVPLAISTRALVAVAGIVAGAAFAAATPITPPPGAVVTTAHPQFNWTLPPNEQTDAIFIASKPDVTPEGKFYDENIVDGEVFTTAVNEWSPSSPLYAGRYWPLPATRAQETPRARWSKASRRSGSRAARRAPRRFPSSRPRLSLRLGRELDYSALLTPV
jgi:hypothetical protein